jgi:CheY-like chemotaxis protein/HPt (histidine-containing phosphotransfer) domain-containing protein
MREIRPSGSEGGAGFNPWSLPLSAAAAVVLRFSTKDTGIGIPAAKQALLFQKFSQVDTSMTRRYGGTGLGLAIAKELVTRMGGEIGVVSEEGRGAEFWFTVRLTPARTAARAATLPGDTHAALFTLCRGRGRILLAEDNPTNTEVALGILEKMGLPVDAVATGTDALRALATTPYDLVLMDVQMPEMDGLEATHCIRQAEGAVLNPNLPIIAMTAHAMPGDRERCLAAGMNDYVQKPVSPQTLATVLNRWLPSPSATGEAGTGQRPHPPAAGPAEVSAAPRPGRASVQVFNRANLLARVLGDQPLADRIIRGFLTDLPRQIERLRTLLEQGDAPGVERQAHSIKSAAASVGGEMLCVTAFALEMAGKNGELHRVTNGLAELQTQFDQLRQALTAELPACAQTNCQPAERTQPPAISPAAQEL